MKNTKYLLTLLICLCTLNMSFAQETEETEETSPFTLTGSVDTYFRVNLNSGNVPGDGSSLAPGTSFANLPGFSLGMVNLIGSYESDKVGVVADLVLGPRGQEAVFGSITNSNIINQLYVYYNVSESFTLTLGNFNTFLGYEVISPAGNFNYSTSYMFSYGPFSHTGLKADFDLGGGFSLMTGVFNPTDATEFNPNGSYVGGAQLGYANDKSSIFLNTIISDGFTQFDITAGTNVTDAVYLGLNATTASDNFSGVAGYVQVATSDALTLGLRGEYFSDNGVGVLNADESVVDLTFSANYTVGNLTFIPEIRVDTLSYDGFATDGNRPGVFNSSSLSSFLLAAVYSF